MDRAVAFINMKIVDGTGEEPFIGHLTIENGVISSVGRGDINIDLESYRVIDGKKRLLLTPGFIDMHSHSDLAPFSESNSLLYKNCSVGKINQGVTTELCGQDGYSGTPILDNRDEYYKLWSGLTGLNNCKSYNTKSVKSYLSATGDMDYPVKIQTLTGHHNLRIAVNGFNSNPLNSKQLDRMKSLLADELSSGSCGLSLGLIYPPGMYADTKELIELARVVGKYDKIIVAHIRNESDMVIKALKEYGDICLEADCNMHISHLKVCGEKNFKLGKNILNVIDSFIEKGLNVTFDLYPYDAGSTMLQAIFPPEAHNGGPGALIERLKDSGEREKIYNKIFHTEDGDWDNFIEFSRGNLRGIIISGAPKGYENISGKSLYDIGVEKGLDPDTEEGRRKTFDIICELEVETSLSLPMVSFNQNMDNVELFLNRQDLMCVGTDGISGQNPHPRLFGSFPKYIKLLKDRSIEEVIHSITGRPGRLLGIKEGILKEGRPGDILVIDLENLVSNPTWENPRIECKGINHIFIDGREITDVRL